MCSGRELQTPLCSCLAGCGVCVSGMQTVQCHCLQSSSNGPAPAYKVKNISCFQECAVEEACISRGFGGAEPWIIP